MPLGTSYHETAAYMFSRALGQGARFIRGTVVSAETTQSPYRLFLSEGKVITTQAFIIATGCSQSPLGLEHEQQLVGNGVMYAKTIGNYSRYHGLRVAIIGDTSSAANEALRVAAYAKRVIIICRGRRMTCNHMFSNLLLRIPTIEVMYNAELKRLIPENSVGRPHLHAIEIDIPSGPRSVKVAEVIGAISLKPRTELFTQIQKNKCGYIKTKSNGSATNLKGIFAAGSVCHSGPKNIISTIASGYNAAVAAERYLTKLLNVA